MKTRFARRKSLFALAIIFSLLLIGSVLAHNESSVFKVFAEGFLNPTPTPQTTRPKRKTAKTESRATGNRQANIAGQDPEPENSNLSPVLASTDFNLIGLVGTVTPPTQTVPKNIPTAVLTSIQVPEGADPAPIIAGLNPNYRVRGELSGPSFTSPRTVEAKIGEQIVIPPMPNVGDHVVQNLRIVDVSDPTGTTLAPVSPDSVGITVIDNILVTQVNVTEMTYDQIIQSGINLNNSNYNFYNFVIGLGTSSGTVPINIPVAMPTTGGQVPVVGNPTGGIGVDGVSLPPVDIVPVMLEAVDGQGNQAPVELPGGGTMQIPGVVVFPGRIGLLHQFFEAIVIVSNGAPNGTPLVITNLKAKAKLPNAGTPNNPDDDPLRIAETQQGGVQTQLEIHGLGPDGRYGTADDTVTFNAGQSGQASFLLEGLREGLHTVDFDIEGTLQGLPSGNVTVHGTVPGAVLVRDAEFGVTFTHPSVVRAGQEYELGVTIYNSGQRNLNGIALNLRGNSVSGATLLDPETKMLTQTISPGNSGTLKWRLRSNTTGQVTASYIKVGGNINAGLNLVTGVGDRNVPLSPDSLILPAPVNNLPPDVVEAARQMLGQAWSVATAPAGSLPAGVLPVDKRTVVNKAIELGWAGLRVDFHEDRDTSLRTLLRDWLGEISANSSTGFADALRSTPAGYYFYDVVGTKFYESVGAQSPAEFHKKLVDAESSRSSFISVYVSQPDGQQILGAKINSPSNQSVGFGANQNERFGDLRTGASLNLLQNDPHDASNNTKGNLLLVSKPTTSGNWSLEINGWADGAADISILAPTSGKIFRQLIFLGVNITAGKRYRISFKASGTAAPIVEEFINGAFRPAVLSFTSVDVNDPSPQITGVVQITENVLEGGDNYGRLVGVLFSKPMVQASAETLTRYQIGGGALVSDPAQIVGKPIKPTGATQNFGGRFTILALDMPVGPFIKRTVTANGITDVAGKNVSGSTKDIEPRVSPQGNPPGGYLTGRVMQADGTPVPNAAIFYRRMKAGFIGGMQAPPCSLVSNWETVSYQKADANGEYAIDYVREGECHPVTALFQNTATNAEKTLVSNVAYNGQHLIFNAVFLARGNVQGMVTSGGVPLANANVSIISELDPLNNKLVKTNSQGFYSATGVPVGGLTIKAVGTGAYSLSSGIGAGSLNEAGGTVTINVSTQNVSGIIRGRVLDSGNAFAPVANSLVVAKANIPGFPGQNGPIPVGYSFTQADGSFTIDRLPVGDVVLQAIDPQRGVSATQTVSLTPQNTEIDGVTILVSNGIGRVLGRVVNEVGQVIPNAVVQEGAQAVRADSAGNYVLQGIREGAVTVNATDTATRQTGSTTVNVQRNQDTTGADIVIRRPSTLNGQVFISQNGTTAPLANAYVTTDGLRIIRTDAQGRYTLNNVQSGKNLTIRFVHPQGRLFVNTDVFLNPGETLSRNATFRPGKIHGRITQPDGVTPVVTGVNYTTVRPHLNQDIFFGLPEESTLTYQTTTDGLYSFDNLNPTGYRVSSSNVFFPIPVSQAGIMPPNGDLEVNLSLVDTLAGKIHGHIYQTDGVTPVGEGVKVTLGGGSLADVTVRTDASGYYEFAEVFAEGSYLLKATDPATGKTNQTGVSVRRNEEITVDLRLLGRGNLRVKVLDGGGAPLQTGSVSINGSGYPFDQRFVELTPNDNGEVEFTSLTEGNYAVSALYNGLGGRVSSTVTVDGTTNVTVQVQAVGSITGRVFMPDGTTPVGLADVTLSQNGRIIGLITTEDSEEERGKFTFSYVPTGDFTIDVFDNRSGRRGRSAGTITTQGQVANVSVNLLALGTVVGQVTANGIPAEHALVNLSADGSGISGTSRVTTTDANGNFRFPGIPVGRVYISVTDGPGGLTGQSQGIVSGTSEPLPETVVNVALTPTAVVTGTVYKFGGNEVYSGALVRVSSNNFAVNTTTDSNGRYRVNFVPLGTVNVKVESPSGYDRGKSETIVSNQAGATVTADVTMTGTGNINGTATDANGNPLTFGKVTFTNTAWGENITFIAPLQPNGSYSMTGLPSGTFNLKLTVPEIVGVGTATDDLSGGQTLVKNLQLEPAGRIFGNVKATDGNSPAVGADVVLTLARQSGGNYNFVTHTDAFGNWTIDNLPLGAIFVRISDANSGGAANLSGLALTENAQQLDTGSVTLDNTPITVSAVAPANNSVNIPKNTAVQIVLSEAVDANSINSGSIQLKLGNNGVAATQSISPDGTTVTLTPNQPLAETQTYSVIVTTQVKDRNGLSLAQQFNSSFTTADQTAPSVSSVNPAHGSTQNALDSSVVVTTNEAVAQDLNLAEIVQISENQTAVAGMISLNETGRIITFVPNSTLSESTNYTVTVNGLRDAVGNTQTESFTSNFSTIDLTAPTINALPIDGTNIEDPRPQIIAGYQDNFSGVNPASVILTVDGVQTTTGLSVSTNSLSYTPIENLSVGNHSVTVRVTDNAGNVSEIRTATFTISDQRPPTVTVVNPANFAQQVALDQVISVQFSEPLDQSQDLSAIVKVREFSQTVPENGTYVLSGDAKTISFTPAGLTANKKYAISVNGQKDVFGNAQTQVFGSSFATLDTTAPEINSFTVNNKPLVGGMIVSTPRPSFLVTFSDNLEIDTNNTKLYLNKVGEPEQQVSAQIEQSRLTFTPTEALTNGTYKIKAVVKDFGGNTAANNEFEFEFSPQQPEILSISSNYSPTSGNTIATIKGSNLTVGEETPNEAQRGLLGEYFECNSSFCTDNIKLVRIDENVDFNAFNESIVPFIAPNQEAIRWRGKIVPRYSENYNFKARFNGSFVLKVNGNTLVDTRSVSVIESAGSIALEADQSYDIEILNTHFYAAEDGNSYSKQHVAQLFWSSPSQAEEIVPALQLRPAVRQTAPIVTVGGQNAAVIGVVSGENDQVSIVLPPHTVGLTDVQVQTESGVGNLSNAVEYYDDVYAPEVSDYSPDYGTLNVLPEKVSITFGEPLTVEENWNQILKVLKASDNSEVSGMVTIDETNRRLRFTPSNPFELNTTYKIVVIGQKDTVGNQNNSESSSYFTVDTQAPNIIWESPENETLVRRPVIRVGFSDSFSALEINSRRLFVDGVEVTSSSTLLNPCNFWFCSPQRSTYAVSYTPPTDLSLGTHSVRVQITDYAGNVADQTLTFAVVTDQQPPTVNSIYIAGKPFENGLRTEQRRPGISMSFRDNGTISAAPQKLFFGPQGGNLTQVSPTVYHYSGSEWILFYSPPQDVPFGFYSYRYELVDDAGNIKTETLNFEVADLDVIQPFVTSVNPPNGANQVDSNTAITLNFSEPLDPNQNFASTIQILEGSSNPIQGNYQLDSAGTTLTFTPLQPLSENMIYVVYGYNYLDLAGNGGQYLYSSFATNDTLPPIIQDGQLLIDEQDWIMLNGAETFDRQPHINVSYYDAVNYIDPNSIVFTLDGQMITEGVNPWGLDYKPVTPLSYGQHTITVQAADIIGNVSAVKTEAFTVLRDPRTPFTVEADTTLLWHLDESGGDYSSQFTPDAGNYRIHGKFPPMTGRSGQKQSSASADFQPFYERGRFGKAVSTPNLASTDDERIKSLGSGGITVEGWAKLSIPITDNLANEPYILWKKGSAATDDFVFMLTPEGNLVARVYNSSGAPFDVEMPKSVFDVTDFQWHSLAMTIESNAGNPSHITIYADGAPRAEATVPSNFGAFRASGGEFRLGLPSYGYNAMHDEVRVSSTTHSAETISKIYNDQLGLVVTRTNVSVIPNDNTSEIIVEGYNLDLVSSADVTELDGSPLPITTTILDSTKTKLKLNVVVPSSVPSGNVKLNISDGQNSVSRNLKIVSQRAFISDAGTQILFDLNEANGETPANAGILGGFAADYSGVASGRFGNGAQYVSTQNNQDSTNIINSSFTTEIWVKSALLERDLKLFTYGTDYDGQDVKKIAVSISSRGQLKAVLTDDNQTDWQAQTQMGEINLFDEQWHLVSMVVSRSAEQNVLKLYVDGVEKASATMPNGFTTISSSTAYRFYAGRFGYNGDLGNIDDFRLLNYARSAGDISNTWLGVNNLSGIGMLLPHKNQTDKFNNANRINSEKSELSDAVSAEKTVRNEKPKIETVEEKPPPKNKTVVGESGNDKSSRSEKVTTNR